MITKNQLKYYSSLLKKKQRSIENKFVVEGKKLVEEGLNSNYKCEIIFCSNAFAEENPDWIRISKLNNYRFEILNRQDFLKISDTVVPQGIAAVFNQPKLKFKPDDIHSDIIIYLDNISDPGNVGTIIRSCDWFGINEIFLGENCAEAYNPKTVRSTAGSIFHIKVYEGINLSSLKKLKEKGYKIFTADLKGENLLDYSFKGKCIVVFSSEAHGPSNEIIKISDKKITIPKLGKAESLNVASAAAVIISELINKRSTQM